MALTNFAALTNEQKTIWSRDVWKHARNMSFINKFAGSGSNAVVQRITDLTKDEKGTRAVMTLVLDLDGDGVAGDNTLEGNEEALRSSDCVIRLDQLRHANRHKGRLADQKSVVNFRENSRDVLAYWLADRIDQLAFLTLSGVSYAFKPDGSTRTGSALTSLEFAADVTAGTSNRAFRWDSATGLQAQATASIGTEDTPSYAALVALKAKAKTLYMRGLRGPGNQEYFHVFLHPLAMAKLKLDTDYKTAVINAAQRSASDNPFFSGEGVTVDGLIIHEFRYVYNTTGLAGGSKWGGGTVDGCRALFLGAQALGMADIGSPYWVEKEFDYDNQPGISVGKMFGFKKPVFLNQYTGQAEDYGVITCDFAM
jgi:N4-gp56 family major capsid protein